MCMTQMHPAYGLGAMPSEAMSGVVLQVVVMMMLWVVVMLGVVVMMWSVVMLVSLMKAQGQGLTRIQSKGPPWEVLCCVDKTPG